MIQEVEGDYKLGPLEIVGHDRFDVVDLSSHELRVVLWHIGVDTDSSHAQVRANFSKAAHDLAHNEEGSKQQGRLIRRLCGLDARSMPEKPTKTFREDPLEMSTTGLL